MNKHELGEKGEDIAARFLEEKGYRILERNWRWGKEEIDIIARDGNFLVIVEVKTRTSGDFSSPESTVTKIKQHILVRAANAYCRYKGHQGEVRFDIIFIIISPSGEEVTHIDDAFYATL